MPDSLDRAPRVGRTVLEDQHRILAKLCSVQTSVLSPSNGDQSGIPQQSRQKSMLRDEVLHTAPEKNENSKFVERDMLINDPRTPIQVLQNVKRNRI